MLPPVTENYQELRSELLALAARPIESNSLRRAVQLNRAEIKAARDAGWTWEKIADVFRRRGFPDAKSETVRNYWNQPDAKIIDRRKKAIAAYPPSAIVTAESTEDKQAPEVRTLVTEDVENPGPTIPGYIV